MLAWKLFTLHYIVLLLALIDVYVKLFDLSVSIFSIGAYTECPVSILFKGS
jgi:hypothetical protein